MSPHGDLIAFGFFALVFVGVPWVINTLYRNYLFRTYINNQARYMRIRIEHEKALEAAIKKLGGCAYGKGR
jgi:hypothetical protein